MDKKLRKHENILVNSGGGVILFAVWGVAKVNLYIGLSSSFLGELKKTAVENGMDANFIVAIMGVIAALILLWQLCTRLYIGINAIAEGKGKNKGWAYLVMTGFFLVTDIQSQWQIWVVNFMHNWAGFNISMPIAFLLEMVSVYGLVELLVSGIWVKKLRKMRKE